MTNNQSDEQVAILRDRLSQIYEALVRFGEPRSEWERQQLNEALGNIGIIAEQQLDKENLDLFMYTVRAWAHHRS